MYYVYLLRSLKDKSYYIGYTRDLRRRFAEHNTGQSTYTSNHIPYELIYYEAYQNESCARRREIRLKQFKNSYKELLKRNIL